MVHAEPSAKVLLLHHTQGRIGHLNEYRTECHMTFGKIQLYHSESLPGASTRRLGEADWANHSAADVNWNHAIAF